MAKPSKRLVADVPLWPDAAARLATVVKSAPAFPCTDACSADQLRKALESGASTLGALLVQLYAAYASPATYAAAGRLAQPLAKPAVHRGAAEVDLDQSKLPYTGHVGVTGDLHVKGDLSVVAALLVTGNLTVDGVLSDCGPESRLIVLGDLRCRALSTSGTVAVQGNVFVEHALWGQYNDEVLEVLGRVEAGLIVSDEHAIEAASFKVRYAPPDDTGSWGPHIFDAREHQDELTELLEDGLVDEEEGVLGEALVEASPPWKA